MREVYIVTGKCILYHSILRKKKYMASKNQYFVSNSIFLILLKSILVHRARMFCNFLSRCHRDSSLNTAQSVQLVEISHFFITLEIPLMFSTPFPPCCFRYTERQAAQRVKPSRNDYNLVRNFVTETTGQSEKPY